MPRILFINVDEQRFDALLCAGGKVTRTPRLDNVTEHRKGIACNYYQFWMKQNGSEQFKYCLSQQGVNGMLSTHSDDMGSIQVHENNIAKAYMRFG